MIERESIEKKAGKMSCKVIYGITSTAADLVAQETAQIDNRGHRSVESCRYIIDWYYDEDRSQIQAGLHLKMLPNFGDLQSVCSRPGSQRKQFLKKMMQLMLNMRAVYGYLKRTRNSNPDSSITQVLATICRAFVHVRLP